jgi:hypothetical protein
MEEHRLRGCENRVLWRIFRLKMAEVTDGWRKLHNKELHSLNSSPSTDGWIILKCIVKRTVWSGGFYSTS